MDYDNACIFINKGFSINTNVFSCSSDALSFPSVVNHLKTTILSLSAGQHITTFDLDHYEFLGPCSYLLTRDFVGGDFTVVGTYEAEAGWVGLASIKIMTPSKMFVLSVNGSVDGAQPHAEVGQRF